MAMSDGGKGSNPRPFAVPFEEFGTSHVRIFGDKSEEKARKQKEKDEYFAKLKAETEARLNNTGTDKNEYYDVLSTEDCFEVDDKLTRCNEETQEALKMSK